MDIRVWVLGLSLALLSTIAHADENRGFYAGSGAGLYYTKIDDVNFDESAGQVRLFGGYQWNEYLAVETGYSKLFEVSASESIAGLGSADIDLDGSSWDVSVRPMLPLSDRFHAFGIVGWASYDLDVNATVEVVGLPPVSVDASESSEELFYGLGAGFDMTDQWTLRGEWINVNVDDGDFGMFSVAATYNFR